MTMPCNFGVIVFSSFSWKHSFNCIMGFLCKLFFRARISGPNNFPGRESTLIYDAEFGTVAPRNYSYTSRMSHVPHPYYPSHSFNEDISVDQTRDVPVRNIARADHTSITRERNLFPSNNTAFSRISTRDGVNHQHWNYMYGYYSDFENLANPQLQSFGSSSTSMQGRASQKGSANPLHHTYQQPYASNLSPGDHSFLVASGFVPGKKILCTNRLQSIIHNTCYNSSLVKSGLHN